MAVVVDSHVKADNADVAGTSLTYAFNNVAGTFLAVWADLTTNASDGGIAQYGSVTYNGVTVPLETSTRARYDPNGVNFKTDDSWSVLKSPATGSHNVVVTTGGGNNATNILSEAISTTGEAASSITANERTAVDNSGSTSSPTISLVSVSTGSLVLVGYSHGNAIGASPTLSGGQTVFDGKDVSGTTGGDNFLIATTTNTGSYSVRLTNASTNDIWGMSTIEILAAVVAIPSGAYTPVRIPNRFVGPAVLRYHYRHPYIPRAFSSASVFQQALTATAVAVTASILKTVNIIRAATSIGVTGSILKQVNTTLSATAVAVTASLVKQVNKLLTATSVVVTGTLSALKAVLLSMTATAVVVTASMTKSVLKNLTATSVAATGSMVKSVGKILSAVSTATATMTKQVGKILTATSVAVAASLSAIKAILVTMVATAVVVTASLTATFQAGAAFLFKYIPLFRPRRR